MANSSEISGTKLVMPFSLVFANVPKINQNGSAIIGSTQWLESVLHGLQIKFDRIHILPEGNSSTGKLIVELGMDWRAFQKAFCLDYMYINAGKGKEHWYNVEGVKLGLHAWFMESYESTHLIGSPSYSDSMEVSTNMLNGFREMVAHDDSGWVQRIQDSLDHAHGQDA